MDDKKYINYVINSNTPQANNFSNYKEGGKDKRNRKIISILSDHLEEKYIIYTTSQGMYLDGNLDPYNNDSELQTFIATAMRYKPRFKRKQYSFYVRLSNIIAACLYGNECHLKMSEEFQKQLIYETQRIGRLAYCLGSFFIAFLTITYAYFIYKQFGLNKNSSDTLLLYICAMGALGGLFSICCGLKDIEVGEYPEFGLNFMSGAFRMIIALIGAFFVFLAIKANLLGGIVKDNPYSLLVFGFISGFSEHFVPNALKKVEDGTSNH